MRRWLLSGPGGALLTVAAFALLWLGWQYAPLPQSADWTPQQLATLRSLQLNTLPPLPPDPGNAVADDARAVALGHRLFFDTRLSGTGEVACATCHMPEHAFTDQRQFGVGIGEGDRNTMSLLGVAYSPWLFWDGRKDSLWSQALEPFENPLEHGTDRMQVARLLAADADYRERYEALFGPLPDFADKALPLRASPLSPEPPVQAAWHAMDAAAQHAISSVFANVGKALAAYQRQLLPAPGALDEYIALALQDGRVFQPDSPLSRSAAAGLQLFVGRAQCVDCHNGPLLTNNDFHNTGVLPAAGLLPAQGRALGLRVALEDPFNCFGEFSDFAPEDCSELRFARAGRDYVGAQRVPTLRNIGQSAPYMHAGQIETLAAVVRHYDRAGAAVIGHNEVEPLALRARERRQLLDFLRSLDGPLATEARLLADPADD